MSSSSFFSSPSLHRLKPQQSFNKFTSRSNYLSSTPKPKLLCEASRDPDRFQSIFVNQHQPLLKFDFRERIQELSSSPVGNNRILQENEPYFDFLRNILDQEYTIGYSTLGVKQYNKEIENGFQDISEILKVFEQEDTNTYQAQLLVQLAQKKLRDIYWDPK